MRGAVGAAAGATLVTAGGVLAPIGPISVPAAALGSAQLAFGLAKVNRGAQQLSESGNDVGRPSARNLLGLLPMGQKFDDPQEPTPVEYAKEVFKHVVRDPIQAVKSMLADFFAVD
jgi:hypothetical protein